MKILIIGLGSIAKKHITILKEINSEFKFYALRHTKSSDSWKDVINIYSWEEVKSSSYYFSIISSPSHLHLEHIKKLTELQIPLMVEKPLFISKKQLNEFDKEKIHPTLYVAFNMRFHPLIIFLKEYLKKNQPLIYEVNTYCGSYLPDWRLTNHKNSYSSKANLGGGVYLDLMHELDYLIYLFGMPLRVNKNNRRVSDITEDSSDYSNITFDYKDFSAQIILNYYRRDKKRILEIVTAKNSLEIDFIKGTVIDLLSKKLLFKSQADLMKDSYKNQINYLLKSIDSKNIPINNLSEARGVLKKIL